LVTAIPAGDMKIDNLFYSVFTVLSSVERDPRMSYSSPGFSNLGRLSREGVGRTAKKPPLLSLNENFVCILYQTGVPISNTIM
jgi:hypothetical protein